jgi:hypothetical protein
MKFDLEKKGYKRIQVDEYIFALRNEYESKLAELAELQGKPVSEKGTFAPPIFAFVEIDKD